MSRPLPATAVKLVVFAATCALFFGVLAVAIGNLSFRSTRTYSAMFTDATGVATGDRVRFSGVEVGSVRGVRLNAAAGKDLAKVTFEVDQEVPMYATAQLQLRYENLLGQRYLAISAKPGSARKMPEESTYPVAQTTPALNLTDLFDGFQPLFRAIEPERVNTLSLELVRAFQGEATSVSSLMRHLTSLTSTVANRQAVIDQVIDNLNQVLVTVASRDANLTALIVEFKNLMTGLAKDKDSIGASLTDTAELLTTGGALLEDVRGPLHDNVVPLAELSSKLYATREEMDASLTRLPTRLRAVNRAGSYGSFFNFYLCQVGIQITLLQGKALSMTSPSVAANERDTVCGGGEGP
ncbi:MlaD family protein [Nocardioides sp. NPDC127514]|uniref:MlaD family protein n=1 Tax=unclassified Nocardioides TaxID=2615069 RepID=UPI00331FA49D